jgi:two-component system NtrC family sensor kinase
MLHEEPAFYGGYDLASFDIRDLTETGRALREMGCHAGSMEEVAGKVVRYMYDSFLCGVTGERECALVRVFETHDFDDLDEELKAAAEGSLKGRPAPPGLKCFVLLATAGEKPEWNLRASSAGHRAIPMPDEDSVIRIPMFWGMLEEMGLPINSVIRPEPGEMLDMTLRNYNVFFVPDALASPYIPAKDNFVVPHGIKSALAFGGALPNGNIFSVIMFLKTRIDKDTAGLFSTMSLNVKLALMPYCDRVFSGREAREVE